MQHWELYVIPEDRNLQEVVNGFNLVIGYNTNRWKLYPVARRKKSGWIGAVEVIKDLNLPYVRKRHVLLVIDFDVDPKRPPYGYENNLVGARFAKIEQYLNEMQLMECRDQIHILGVCQESEDLRRIAVADWGASVPKKPFSYESIGQCLAEKCKNQDFGVWYNSPVLNGNGEELRRMQRTVCVNLTLPHDQEKRIRT